MKKYYTIGFTLFGLIGSWLGAALDHGNWFGAWSTIFGLIGSVFGLWVGYLVVRYIDG